MEKLVNMVPYSDSPRGGVQSQVDALNSSLAKLYPIGSIYLSVNSTNPSTFIGGTWERLKDRFLLAAGDTYAAGNTGGEAQHTLTTAEMPSHTHAERIGDSSNPNQLINELRVIKKDGSNGGGAVVAGWNSYGLGDRINTTWEGGSKSHNNMPPYLAVYMWVRTA